MAISCALIAFLVEQAREGMKVDKTFKKQAFVAATSFINAKFHTDMTFHNVDHHLKTLKLWHKEMIQAYNVNGAGWDEENKMIVMDAKTANEYLQVHSKAKAYINKPIPYFEDLCVVCGDDYTTGSFSKTLFVEEVGEMASGEGIAREYENVMAQESGSEDISNIPSSRAPPAATAPPAVSSVRVRARDRRTRDVHDTTFSELMVKVGELADSVKQLGSHWSVDVHHAIWSLEGSYPVSVLDAAFDYLFVHEFEARSFAPNRDGRASSHMDGLIS